MVSTHRRVPTYAHDRPRLSFWAVLACWVALATGSDAVDLGVLAGIERDLASLAHDVTAEKRAVLSQVRGLAHDRVLTHAKARAAPRVFVYALDGKHREGGTVDCASLDCAFGGPPKQSAFNFSSWKSGQFNFPWMLYYRLMKSPHRVLDPKDADLFVVPAWSRNGVPCSGTSTLWAELRKQNPLLSSARPGRGEAVDARGKDVARRHILLDPRTLFVCPYLCNTDGTVGDMFTRVNLEVVQPKWDMALRKGSAGSPDRLVEFEECSGSTVQRCTRPPYNWYKQHACVRRAPRGAGRRVWMLGFFGAVLRRPACISEGLAVFGQCHWAKLATTAGLAAVATLPWRRNADTPARLAARARARWACAPQVRVPLPYGLPRRGSFDPGRRARARPSAVPVVQRRGRARQGAGPADGAQGRVRPVGQVPPTVPSGAGSPRQAAAFRRRRPGQSVHAVDLLPAAAG